MVRYGAEKPERTGFTTNLSITGLHIKANHVLAPGSLLQIEIKFPQRQFQLTARVMWAKRVPSRLAHRLPSGMGVRFVDPGEEWKEFYRRWDAGEA
jgi:hypothetical protein